jgi:predicted Zn-dependent peptidase
MMYEQHSYRWPVIGLTPEHVENASIDDVRHFYRTWYTPANAVLSIAGNISVDKATELAAKWFADIPSPASPPARKIQQEPAQSAAKRCEVHTDVPVRAMYLAFRTPARLTHDFYAVDLLSDILAQGHSARLYRRLLKEQPLFSQIDAYITASIDPGLFVIEGRPAEGVSIEECTEAVWAELEKLKAEPIEERELTKIKHRFESTVVFSETSVLNKAQNLGYYELISNAELMNDESDIYLGVTSAEIQQAAKTLFRQENSGLLVYYPK